ncbi:IclR family transcriptional regulator [Arthrobacter sp. 135MFCol5.1]|uniref:IclR family transcriptional regulator n=1 Tax=Arthrobacter sp. 135MFCol5.1 TaxID=1158050 RepID=UPI00035CA7F5|nr:IclR family transcriptional regulator [Arthrobacter sp. 135MFCol5.1]
MVTNTGDPDLKSQTRIQSVSRAVQILLAVAESEGLQAKQVSERFGLSLPTTYHLLTTLAAEGMVTKDDRRYFRLGPRAAIISDAYARADVVPASYARAINSLAQSTGETTYLSVWRGGAVKVLATAEGAHAVRVVGLDTGYSDNVHARASGKLLLAFAPVDVREAAIERMRFTPLTPNTITKKKEFRQELEAIRERGYSFDRQEFQLGVDCVCFPIFQAEHVVACITISSPSTRFVDTKEDLLAKLAEITATLSVN